MSLASLPRVAKWPGVGSLSSGHSELATDIQRIRAIMQLVHSWPVFNMKQGLTQQLSKFESGVREYEFLLGNHE